MGDIELTVTFTQGEWQKILQAIRIIEEAVIRKDCIVTDPRKEEGGE